MNVIRPVFEVYKRCNTVSALISKLNWLDQGGEEWALAMSPGGVEGVLVHTKAEGPDMLRFCLMKSLRRHQETSRVAASKMSMLYKRLSDGSEGQDRLNLLLTILSQESFVQGYRLASVDGSKAVSDVSGYHDTDPKCTSIISQIMEIIDGASRTFYSQVLMIATGRFRRAMMYVTSPLCASGMEDKLERLCEDAPSALAALYACAQAVMSASTFQNVVDAVAKNPIPSSWRPQFTVYNGKMDAMEEAEGSSSGPPGDKPRKSKRK
jgi:hypothetical protein